MDCPKCEAEMRLINVGGFLVDRCTGCAGLWFDLGEFQEIAEHKQDVAALDIGLPAEGARQNLKRDLDCPRCHVKMLKMNIPRQSHIAYESCPVCYGAFFDAGEFTDFAKFTLTEQVTEFFRHFKKKS